MTRYGKGDDNGKGASAVQKAINRILEKCGESGGIQALERLVLATTVALRSCSSVILY